MIVTKHNNKQCTIYNKGKYSDAHITSKEVHKSVFGESTIYKVAVDKEEVWVDSDNLTFNQ